MKKAYCQILAFALASTLALAISVNASAFYCPNSQDVDPIDADSPHTITAEPYRLTSVPASPEFALRVQQLSLPATTNRLDIKPKQMTPYTHLMFGQEVRANDGATYYASADQLGSGRQGTANNPYTAQLYIAGFALVRIADGHILASKCYTRDNIPVGKTLPDPIVELLSEYNLGEVKLFIATYTDGFTTGSVGWFAADDLTWKLNSLTLAEDGSGAKDPTTSPTYSGDTPTGGGSNESESPLSAREPTLDAPPGYP